MSFCRRPLWGGEEKKSRLVWIPAAELNGVRQGEREKGKGHSLGGAVHCHFRLSLGLGMAERARRSVNNIHMNLYVLLYSLLHKVSVAGPVAQFQVAKRKSAKSWSASEGGGRRCNFCPQFEITLNKRVGSRLASRPGCRNHSVGRPFTLLLRRRHE